MAILPFNLSYMVEGARKRKEHVDKSILKINLYLFLT